jgi:hypothetical protein
LLGVPQHKLDLFARHPGKPFQKFVDPRATFQILEQHPDRDARVLEKPLAATLSGQTFDRWAVTPIEHSVILRGAVRIGKLGSFA